MARKAYHNHSPEVSKKIPDTSPADAEKQGHYEVVTTFSDYGGSEVTTYTEGDDVSHIPENKLRIYEEAGYVKKVL